MDHEVRDVMLKIGMAVLLLFSVSWVAYTIWQDLQEPPKVVRVCEGDADLFCFFTDGGGLYCRPPVESVELLIDCMDGER